MSIFPERDRQGQPTGIWVIEVKKTVQGVSKTIRKRTRDHTEAIQIEAVLRGTLGSKAAPMTALSLSRARTRDSFGAEGFSLVDMTPPPKIFTLQNLYDEAHSIYRGNKDELQSCERLHAALEIIGWGVDLQNLRTPAMDFLVETLLGRGLSGKTVNRYLYAISGVLRWALQREMIPGMPIIPRQNEGVGRLHYLTKEDQDRLVLWLAENDFSDVAFVSKVLLVSGLRITEFLNLRVADVRDGWIILHAGETKNDQGREVFVGPLAGALSAAIAEGLPTYLRIVKGLSLASAALGLSPKVTPHMLRHSCATMLTTRGVSLATVGKILGHKSLVTTQRYAHVEDRALIDAARLLLDV
jgi:site-specific recombinase XerD